MKVYEEYLSKRDKSVTYVDSTVDISDMRNFDQELKDKGIEKINIINPTDDWLMQRIEDATKNCDLVVHSNPMFINTEEDLSDFFRADKKSFFQTKFYKQQRKKLDILIDEDGGPEGGNWTYDKENRKKYPKKKTPPNIQFPTDNELWNEAVDYTEKHFSDNYGSITKQRLYPIDYDESNEWLEQFFVERFHEFGAYEDAIVRGESILNHSVLTPMLNIGLLLPGDVIDKTVEYAKANNVPINSTEGFVRQIIGWREFIRGMYMCKGRFSRTKNFWGFNRKIPKSFYDGSTGIPPIDETIKKVLDTGYCHHIERLMVIGNFMLLCEFDPDEVYRWFMELFIDAYDWVMVPNVYGMCQFADGGTFATKPYIGGSNYIKKMSNYPKGDWEKTWDGLFWSFMMNHKDFFQSNPRIGMLVHTLNKMSDDKKDEHRKNAEKFIADKL
jgi:deoxyribodipyrimidine photolyase-related protein